MKITVELDDGTTRVIDGLDDIRVSQNRPVIIRRRLNGSIESMERGHVTTTTIVGLSERKSS